MHMLKLASVSALLLAAAFTQAGCTSPVRVSDPTEVTAVAHATYAFAGSEKAPDGFKRSGVAAEVEKDARASIDKALGAKGYTAASVDEADLLFVLGTGRRVVERGGVSRHGGGADIASFDELVTSGSLIVDVFDRRTQRSVWRGQVIKEVTPGSVDAALVDRAVTEVMVTFPAAGK